jgi:hypothetical protein
MNLPVVWLETDTCYLKSPSFYEALYSVITIARTVNVKFEFCWNYNVCKHKIKPCFGDVSVSQLYSQVKTTLKVSIQWF